LHTIASDSRALRWGIAQRFPNARQRRKGLQRTPHSAQKCTTKSRRVEPQPPTVLQRKWHPLGNLITDVVALSAGRRHHGVRLVSHVLCRQAVRANRAVPCRASTSVSASQRGCPSCQPVPPQTVCTLHEGRSDASLIGPAHFILDVRPPCRGCLLCVDLRRARCWASRCWLAMVVRCQCHDARSECY